MLDSVLHKDTVNGVTPGGTEVPEQPSRTTDANLDRVFDKSALLLQQSLNEVS